MIKIICVIESFNTNIQTQFLIIGYLLSKSFFLTLGLKISELNIQTESDLVRQNHLTLIKEKK